MCVYICVCVCVCDQPENPMFFFLIKGFNQKNVIKTFGEMVYTCKSSI